MLSLPPPDKNNGTRQDGVPNQDQDHHDHGALQVGPLAVEVRRSCADHDGKPEDEPVSDMPPPGKSTAEIAAQQLKPAHGASMPVSRWLTHPCGAADGEAGTSLMAVACRAGGRPEAACRAGLEGVEKSLPSPSIARTRQSGTLACFASRSSHRWSSWLPVQADQPRRCLAGRGKPQPVRMGQLGPREQLGDLRMPSSVRPGGPTDRVVRRPPAPRWRGGGVCPIAAAGQPEPDRAGQDAPLHDPARIVQGDNGVGVRVHHQLGVVRGHRRTPTGSRQHRWRPRPGWRSWGPRRRRGRRVRGAARPAAPRRAGEGGLAAAGAADHNDPLGDRFGGRRMGCHMGKVGRRWWCRQDPAGRSGVLGSPGRKQVDGL
jgi:hypothetical protein